ncbi:MAG: cell division protein FtsQ/DivIB [Pseudomonadota bacterium]
MPAVKKKKAKAKTKKRKSARRGPSIIERLVLRVREYTLAATAGAFVIVAGIVFVLWSGGYVGMMAERLDRTVSASFVAAGLDIRRVTMMGRDETDLADVEDAVGPVIGASMAHLDLDAMRARIENIGWVRSAAVNRLWPNTVHVSIREREPAAVWQLSGKLHLIDDSGAVIRQVGAYEYSSLPLIVGAGAPEAVADILQALQSQPELKKMTAALVRVGERRWNMRLHNKMDIKLPEKGIGDALEALSIMHASQGTLDQNIEYIDLRDSERVIVRPRKGPEAADAPAAN